MGVFRWILADMGRVWRRVRGWMEFSDRVTNGRCPLVQWPVIGRGLSRGFSFSAMTDRSVMDWETACESNYSQVRGH